LVGWASQSEADPSAFNGRPAAGTWKLVVSDGFAGDTGTLDAWLLEVDVK